MTRSPEFALPIGSTFEGRYEILDELLENKVLNETRWVKENKEYIETKREEAKDKLPVADLFEALPELEAELAKAAG